MSGDYQRRYLGGQAWGFDEHFEGARFHCRHFAGSLKGVLLNAWRERVNKKCTITEVEYLGLTQLSCLLVFAFLTRIVVFLYSPRVHAWESEEMGNGGLSLEGGGLGCSDD